MLSKTRLLRNVGVMKVIPIVNMPVHVKKIFNNKQFL